MKNKKDSWKLKAMWNIKDLRDPYISLTSIDGVYVPARPLNYRKEYCSFFKRLYFACQVLNGTAETFVWDEGQ